MLHESTFQIDYFMCFFSSVLHVLCQKNMMRFACWKKKRLSENECRTAIASAVWNNWILVKIASNKFHWVWNKNRNYLNRFFHVFWLWICRHIITDRKWLPWKSREKRGMQDGKKTLMCWNVAGLLVRPTQFLFVCS